MDNPDFIKSQNLTRYAIIGVLLLLLLVIFQKFFVVIFLIAINIFISFYIGKYQVKNIGIELVTFTTILTGVVFGPATGAMVGLALIISHLIIGHFAFGAYILWLIPSYIVLGFLSGAVTGFDFFALGIYLTLGMNAFNLILTALIFPQNLGNYLPYSITNIMFNFIMFSFFGPAIYGLVK